MNPVVKQGQGGKCGNHSADIANPGGETVRSAGTGH